MERCKSSLPSISLFFSSLALQWLYIVSTETCSWYRERRVCASMNVCACAWVCEFVCVRAYVNVCVRM